jgi:2-hydroxychromene-2-carboxylate isomerase
MSATLEFFYDYVSPYSYLANKGLGEVDTGAIRYRPMFLGAVMKATGNTPPAYVEAKGAYLRRDIPRWAAHYGIPFRFNSVFPQNTLPALRLALVAQGRGTFEALHQRLFDAMFVDDLDLSDAGVLRALLEDAGLDAEEYLAAAESDEIKDELRANTDEAIQRGAFGAPTIFVGDEMFFGNDRFAFVRAALDRAT